MKIALLAQYAIQGIVTTNSGNVTGSRGLAQSVRTANQSDISTVSEVYFHLSITPYCRIQLFRYQRSKVADGCLENAVFSHGKQCQGKGILELRRILRCAQVIQSRALRRGFPSWGTSTAIAKDSRKGTESLVSLVMEMRITPPWGNPFETVESCKHVTFGLLRHVCDSRRPLMHQG